MFWFVFIQRSLKLLPLLRFPLRLPDFSNSLTLQEKFVKRCKAITEKISEETSEVEGEWLTVADMEKLEFTPCLCSTTNSSKKYLGILHLYIYIFLVLLYI